jgi:hypothetical protein
MASARPTFRIRLSRIEGVAVALWPGKVASSGVRPSSSLLSLHRSLALISSTILFSLLLLPTYLLRTDGPNTFGAYLSNVSILPATDGLIPGVNLTGACALGRPWNNASVVVFMDSYMSGEYR